MDFKNNYQVTLPTDFQSNRFCYLMQSQTLSLYSDGFMLYFWGGQNSIKEFTLEFTFMESLYSSKRCPWSVDEVKAF